MKTFRELLAEPVARLAPAVFNPLCAKLAEQAGFEMLYLGGGPLGYIKGCLEAGLSLADVVAAGVEIRAASRLPLIMDGTCGWGDPMHVHHTMHMAEAAGFCAIELEDQILPKRAHHHVGVEHMIPAELMVAKIREAVRARRDPDFAIIARTNAIRASGMDDALRRAAAYRAAGADMLFLMPRDAGEMRLAGERLAAPLMVSLQGDGIAELGMTHEELGALGYRVLTIATPVLAFHRAMKQTYAALAAGSANPVLAGTTRKAEQAALHDTLGLDVLLAVEKATVER